MVTLPNSCSTLSCGYSQMGFTCICLIFALGTSLPYIHQNMTSHENCTPLGYYAVSTATHCIVTQNSAILICLWQKHEITHLTSHQQYLLKKINVYKLHIEICVACSLTWLVWVRRLHYIQSPNFLLTMT